MQKIFILDTNVLLHDINCLSEFADNILIIPIVVIEELDKFKTETDELGKSARLASRKLDEFRERGSLSKGVETEGGGQIKVVLDLARTLPREIILRQADNRILNTAYHFKKTEKKKVILVSKDTNLRLKAEAIGIEAQDYKADKVKISELYTGVSELSVKDKSIDDFYQTKEFPIKRSKYYPNQFIVLKSETDEKKSALGRVTKETDLIKPVMAKEPVCWGIKPLNKEQRFAMELLLDDNISLVTLVGIAGTGKTLISIATGLQKAIEENAYRRLIVCRSVVPVGRDIGFLPGTKEEKLDVWMGAIYDNLEFLADRKQTEKGHKLSDYLLETGKVEIASVTHIRGRTLPGQYMIVDDAQNLSPHEIKTILSRAGKGTKVVVTGDPYQIDTPYLDADSNGLTYLVDRFKGQIMHGHVTFTKTERSPLAAKVAELL